MDLMTLMLWWSIAIGLAQSIAEATDPELIAQLQGLYDMFVELLRAYGWPI